MKYLSTSRADNRAWRKLPAAELVLSITVDGKTYRGIAGGEWTQFTRVGGGFGFDGANHLEELHSPELEPGHFILELSTYLAADSMPSRHAWLVGKNRNEWTEGNYGIMLAGGIPRVWLNIGGGRENCFHVGSTQPLTVEQWYHLAATYDGEILRFYVNGAAVGSRKIGRTRQPGGTLQSA